MNNRIKFVFFGTPKVAMDTLETLKSQEFLPSLIVTASDMPVGRKQIITPPPVKLWATENNIKVLQPEKLDSEFQLEIKNYNLDISIVVAYGKIFPETLINIPKLGTLNIHYSLLPKYRGASPVQAAILNGEIETGVTIQKMVKTLDAGPIVMQEKVAIEANEKTPELLEKLTKVGGEMLVNLFKSISQGVALTYNEQTDIDATFCPKINKEDGLIDLNGDPIKNYNKFRAFYEWPRIYFIKDNKRVIVTDAEFIEGNFVIKKVIPEGKKEMNYSDFVKN